MRGAAPQVLEAALLCSPWPLLDLNYGGKGVLWKSQMRIRPQGLAIGFNEGASHFVASQPICGSGPLSVLEVLCGR